MFPALALDTPATARRRFEPASDRTASRRRIIDLARLRLPRSLPGGGATRSSPGGPRDATCGS